LGISNVTVAQLDVARSITPIVSVQNLYSLRKRTSEGVLAACERLGIAFLPWNPLGGKRGLKALKIKQVIFADRSGVALTKDYTFDLSAIRRVTLSPWIVRDLADSIIKTLRQIDGCNQLKIYRSTLIDNAEWKKFALALDHPKSE
jgi:hypothetical protein